MNKIDIGANVIRFVDVDSTNRVALSSKHFPSGTIFIAKTQSSGLGRHNRKWISPKGGLYLSLLLKDLPNIIEYQMASILCGFCVVKTCKDFLLDGHFSIKWPNDIIIEDKKICGILAQTVVSGEKSRGAIGIGINVNSNLEDFQFPLCDNIISLKELTDNVIPLSSFEKKLIIYIKSIFKNNIRNTFIENLPDINDLLYKKGEQGKLLIRGEVHKYRIMGILEDCSISVEDSHGNQLAYSICEFL
ncbi:biotin--[acetyl-CoA-carboxylase] ligase [bacterium]|nr:biotin--[acetyl-CoA-carboxylase] ligase [bacterium]